MSYSNSSAKNEFKKGCKNGSQYIELESFKPKRIYAITYSPYEQPSDFTNRGLSLYHKLEIDQWTRIQGISYFLLPEFGAEGNRLHYHGIIAFATGMDYLRFKDRFKTQHVVVKKIFNASYWLYYMTKQWKHLSKVFFVLFGDFNMYNDWWQSCVFIVPRAKLIFDEVQSKTERLGTECDER